MRLVEPVKLKGCTHCQYRKEWDVPESRIMSAVDVNRKYFWVNWVEGGSETAKGELNTTRSGAPMVSGGAGTSCEDVKIRCEVCQRTQG